MTQLTVHRPAGGEMTPDPCHRVAAAVKCSDVPAEVTCKACKRSEQAPAGPSWLTLRASDFDAAAPLTLFDIAPAPRATVPVGPDKYGTPDMFGDLS